MSLNQFNCGFKLKLDFDKNFIIFYNSENLEWQKTESIWRIYSLDYIKLNVNWNVGFQFCWIQLSNHCIVNMVSISKSAQKLKFSLCLTKLMKIWGVLLYSSNV